MPDIKDWRGTPITVGAKVITRSATKMPTWRLGIVAKLNDSGSLTIATAASDWRHGNKLVPLWPGSVTVLTKDMFDCECNWQY